MPREPWMGDHIFSGRPGRGHSAKSTRPCMVDDRCKEEDNARGTNRGRGFPLCKLLELAAIRRAAALSQRYRHSADLAIPIVAWRSPPVCHNSSATVASRSRFIQELFGHEHVADHYRREGMKCHELAKSAELSFLGDFYPAGPASPAPPKFDLGIMHVTRFQGSPCTSATN
jgi:hypothetical protein